MRANKIMQGLKTALIGVVFLAGIGMLFNGVGKLNSKKAKSEVIQLPVSGNEVECPRKDDDQYKYKMGFCVGDILSTYERRDVEFIINYLVESGNFEKEEIERLKEIEILISDTLPEYNNQLEILKSKIPESVKKTDLIGKYHVCNYQNALYDEINHDLYKIETTSSRGLRDSETLEFLGYIDLTYSRDQIEIRCESSSGNSHLINCNKDVLFLRKITEGYYEECLGYEQKEWIQFITDNPNFFTLQEEMIETYELMGEYLGELFPHSLSTVSRLNNDFLAFNKYLPLKEFRIRE